MIARTLSKSLLVVFALFLYCSTSVFAQNAPNSQRVGDRNIFVKMNAGDPDLTLATMGPLELFARCSAPGPFKLAQVFLTSSEDGWLAQSIPLTAGTLRFVASIGSSAPVYGSRIDGIAAVSPSGHYLAVDREIFSVGVNILGSDCVFTGQVVTAREQN